MIYQPRFKFIDRGFKKNILLIPGWATDEGIFEKIDIPFNYLLPQNFLPQDFENKILLLAKMSPELNINLLGWSMGGFIAANLFTAYPEMFDKLILVSMRQGYDKAVIDRLRGYLKRNSKVYLCKFYENFFSDDEKESRVWFSDNLMKKYTQCFEASRLFEGLDYLENTELNTNLLNNANVTLVHGENDLIAPFDGARQIAKEMPRAKFISIKGAGHLPFLRKEFNAE